MEQGLRKLILSMVTAARKALEEDVLRQLEGDYGVGASGSVESDEAVARLRDNPRLAAERREIEAAVNHELFATSPGRPADAVERFVREVAFTHLNRLAALKMMEGRGSIPESVGRGRESHGFGLFRQVCPEYTRSEKDAGYRRYLELLFDELAESLRALFDRGLPQSIIFPEPATLKTVLELLNDQKLAPAWAEEETLGWVYQYFTPKDLRERARKESRLPRNSYELAFLNQFYTPSYVVRFLTDNTLGRLWYEARKSDTRLVGQCVFMVRPPGEASPERPSLDPKDIRVLDPACGSGHFLLYSFDLLTTMYEEAGYPREEIPGLILEHNLYGIDIDLRATQIAALALFLRAQAYSPGAPVRKTNIVCAEAMPGNRQLFDEYVAELGSPTLERIAKRLWEDMALAGEAGSLLRPEEKLKTVICEEQQAWRKKPEATQEEWWSEGHSPQLDFSDVTDESFWDIVDKRLLDSLNGYAHEAENGLGASRRLFAHDGAQGIRFLEVLRHKYDVVLMNPPFGNPSKPSKAYIEHNYPLTKNDVYAAFVERGLGLLSPGGRLGAITSRTGFFQSSFQGWREDILLKKARLTIMADLGAGVLDTAMVETAAYCLEVEG